MEAIILWTLAALLILIGIIGAFVPVLPGVLLLFGGMVLAAYIDGFRRVGWLTLAILGILTVLALLGDALGALIGARRVGASRQALVGAAIGGLVGIFFGIVGALLGPFLGAAAGELMSRGRLAEAARVGAGTWIGIALAMAFRLGIVFAMLAVFITRYLLR